MGLNLYILSEIYESEMRDVQVDGSLGVYPIVQLGSAWLPR